MNNMKRLIITLAFLLVSATAQAASISSTTCPGAGCVNYLTGGQGTIGIQITGTWVGTITFYSTIDNTNYTSFVVVSSADTASTGVTTTTANGSFIAAIAGTNQVRVGFSAYTSGTAVVTVRLNTQASHKGGGGTSGGGIITACGSSDTQVLYTDGTTCAGNPNNTYNKTQQAAFIDYPITIGVPESTVDPNYQGWWSPAQTLFTSVQTSTNGFDQAVAVESTGDGLAFTSIRGVGVVASIKPVDDAANYFGYGIQTQTFSDGTRAVQGLLGFSSESKHNSSGGLATLYGGTFQVGGNHGGLVAEAIGLKIRSPAYTVTTVTSHEGLQIEDQTKAGTTTNLAIDVNSKFLVAPDGSTLTTSYITKANGSLSVANVGANSCGTTAATIAGNSNSFEITVGATAGTQCRVTFPVAAPTRYNCTVTDATTTIATRATSVDTTHVDFLGAFVAGDVVVAICLPR